MELQQSEFSIELDDMGPWFGAHQPLFAKTSANDKRRCRSSLNKAMKHGRDYKGGQPRNYENIVRLESPNLLYAQSKI